MIQRNTRRGFTQKVVKEISNRVSSPKAVIGDLHLMGSLRGVDSRPKHSGMTSNIKGFTLIELLVVVLIIAILAAVALPQYQKAVMKSRIVEFEINLKAIAQAGMACYLAKGSSCTDINELDIEPPACKGIPGIFPDEYDCEYKVSCAANSCSSAVNIKMPPYMANRVFDFYLKTNTGLIGLTCSGGNTPGMSIGTEACNKMGFTENIYSSVYKRP